MSLKFEEWFTAQHQREDFIEAFIRGLNVEGVDEKWEKGKRDEHTNWVNIVL